MAKFKVIVSEPEGKSKVVELDGARAVPLIGKKLGETIDGSVVGVTGKKLLITGGSDKDGFPMRKDVHGGVRIQVVVSKGVGFHPEREGERQRKTLRGNVITEDIVQVNVKTLKTEKEKTKKAEKPRKPRKMKEKAPEEKTAEESKPEEVKVDETAENP